MEYQKLMTLRGHLFLGLSSIIVSNAFAQKGRQYCDYG
jgi:hypothetical protein